MAAPIVTVQAAASVDYANETLNGNITADGGATITAKGFNLGLTAGYGTTVSAIDGFTTGAFALIASGLTQNTLYHVQAFATNEDGMGVSADWTFTTVRNPLTNYFGTKATPFILGVPGG